MGQTNSIEEHSQDIKSYINDYEFVRKFTDTRFGEVKLLQEKIKHIKILQKDYMAHSIKDYQEYLNECKKRIAFNHPNIIKIFGYLTKKEDAFCADFFKISFFFENFDHDLEQEIFRRVANKEYFPETEIWYILDSILSAGTYFEINKAIIGDIRPYNILITPSMDYKVVDQGIFGKKTLPNYFGLIQGLDVKNHYLAPEIFKNLNKNKRPEYSPHKADIFSLGMTLIEASNLENLEGCYDWEKFNFNEEHLRSALEKVNLRYGDNLANILTQMTLPTENARPDFRTLDAILSPRRPEIRSRFIKREVIVEEKIEVVKLPEIKEDSPPKKKEAIKHTGESPKKEAATEHHHVQKVVEITPQKEEKPIIEDTMMNDLDRRIREAVQLTEDTLARTSPTKYRPISYDEYLSKVSYNPIMYEQQPQIQVQAPILVTEQYKPTTEITYHVPQTTEVLKSAAAVGVRDHFTNNPQQSSYILPTATANLQNPPTTIEQTSSYIPTTTIQAPTSYIPTTTVQTSSYVVPTTNVQSSLYTPTMPIQTSSYVPTTTVQTSSYAPINTGQPGSYAPASYIQTNAYQFDPTKYISSSSSPTPITTEIKYESTNQPIQPVNYSIGLPTIAMTNQQPTTIKESKVIVMNGDGNAVQQGNINTSNNTGDNDYTTPEIDKIPANQPSIYTFTATITPNTGLAQTSPSLYGNPSTYVYQPTLNTNPVQVTANPQVSSTGLGDFDLNKYLAELSNMSKGSGNSNAPLMNNNDNAMKNNDKPKYPNYEYSKNQVESNEANAKY